MHRSFFRFTLVSGLFSMLLLSTASAGGFQLNEHGVAGLGRGFSGYGVDDDYASVLFYNPAGLTLIEAPRLQLGTTVVASSIAFSDQGSFQSLLANPQNQQFITRPSLGHGDNGGTTAVVPNFFYARPFTDRWYAGIGITAPFGLRTDYDRDWIGRYHALESELVTIDINPAIAYRINDKLAVGAGISAQYAEATLSRAVFVIDPASRQQLPDGFAKVEGDDWSWGWNVGLTYEPTDRVRAGLSYRSKVLHTLKGSRHVAGVPGAGQGFGARASVDLPESAYLGLRVALTERWEITGGARWTRWTRFDELRVQFNDGGPDDVTAENWDNSWTLSAGAQFRFSERWDFRAGYVYDETPIADASHRTPRIPDADRQWATLGATFRPNARWQFDFGYAHLFVESAGLVNTIDLLPSNVSPPGVFTDTLVGTYGSSDAELVGLQFLYSFDTD